MALAAKILLIIASIGLIIVVLLQSGKSAGLSGAISGGAEQMMGKQKARGIDALLGKLTVIFAVAFMVFSILLGYFLKSGA
ncbi:preprotein translocase subunit SecG [Brevibacillus borstelensis]|uniref:preprotein translocase subunit SecG n=1 Tax=Brevibacillus borstelensis TaxID=45462 RepID=UPI0030BBEA17